MSAARRARRAGRNLLVALLVGAVIIAAIVVAYVAGRSATTPRAAPPPAPIQSSAVATSSATADAAPTGCLGGQQRDVAMLLTAQREASHTTFGAVEVAAAFFRWSYRYPVPSDSQISRAAALFVPGDSASAQSSLRADYLKNPNPSSGQVPDATPFYLSTVGGKWIAQTSSTPGAQLVSVQAPFVIDGAVSATKSTTESFSMIWVKGAWRVAGLAKADPAKLSAGGTAFTAGC
jgi:hypothetical protein